MALYEGLKSSSEKAEPAAPRPALRPLPVYEPRIERPWKELHHERSGSRPSGGFLDNLLGSGTQAKLSGTCRPLKAPTKALLPPPGGAVGRRPTEGVPWKASRVEAVGSGQRAIPRGKKGVGRSILVLLLLAWGLVRLHPWTRIHVGRFDFAALSPQAAHAPAVRVVADESPATTRTAGWTADLASLFRPANAVPDAAAKEKSAEDATQLAALPVDPAGGTALALWQDAAGRWWQVNAQAELRPCAGPADKDSLGLPELRGVVSQAEEHGQGKRLSLKLPAGLLKELLPLEPSVASEVRAVLLDDPSQPALLTHDGTRCLLDASDWERRQRRLGLVLADLAAKKRRAALIDLRYEDTAVVRPAGRV